jgi:hypothetical protein
VRHPHAGPVRSRALRGPGLCRALRRAAGGSALRDADADHDAAAKFIGRMPALRAGARHDAAAEHARGRAAMHSRADLCSGARLRSMPLSLHVSAGESVRSVRDGRGHARADIPRPGDAGSDRSDAGSAHDYGSGASLIKRQMLELIISQAQGPPSLGFLLRRDFARNSRNSGEFRYTSLLATRIVVPSAASNALELLRVVGKDFNRCTPGFRA